MFNIQLNRAERSGGEVSVNHGYPQERPKPRFFRQAGFREARMHSRGYWTYRESVRVGVDWIAMEACDTFDAWCHGGHDMTQPLAPYRVSGGS